MSNTPTNTQPTSADQVIEQAAVEVANRLKLIDEALAKLPSDPGALFEQTVLDALRVVRADSPAHYARIREKAKEAKGVVVELDRLTRVEEAGSDEVVDQLIRLAKHLCKLAHDADRQGVAIIDQSDRQEVWMVRGSGFASWLRSAYFDVYESGFGDATLSAALNTIEAIGLNRGDLVEVHLRTAKRGDAYYVDLCDERWRVVKISPGGYEVLDRSPVLFTRNDKMRPLPLPQPGGDIDRLWNYANVPESQRPLAIAFLLDAMRPDTPYPVLEIVGEQGSAKSTTQKYLRELIDPNKVPLRGSPDTTEDIYVSAANNAVVSYENLSFLSPESQDALCTLATGGGYATRKFYTNGEEHLLATKRPVMLNSISGVCSRPDLIERTVRIDAPSIPQDMRVEETQLEKGWNDDYPKIFGALLERFAHTLDFLRKVELISRQRMADFQRLGEAMMQATSHVAGTFSDLYGKAVKDGTERALENYGIVAALVSFMDSSENKKGHWTGLVGVLYSVLGQESIGMDRSNWPKSAKGLSDQLKRLAPALRGQGLEVRIGDRINTGRLLTITRQPAAERAKKTGAALTLVPGSPLPAAAKPAGAEAEEREGPTKAAAG